MLNNGQRLETTLGKFDVKVSQFDEYTARIGAAPLNAKESQSLTTVDSLALALDPSNRHLGELSWRLGFAFAAANLMIIAVATSRINPRMGRTGNLVFSLFTFQIYLNLLNMGQSWISQGKIGFLPFFALLHGGILALALLWLMKHHHNWEINPWALLQRRRP